MTTPHTTTPTRQAAELGRPYVTGLFRDDAQAAQAVECLLEGGFAASDIGVLKSDGGKLEEVDIEHRTGVPTGAAVGSSVGAVLGGAGAGLVSVGLLGATGLGLVAAGPIVAALQGSLFGAASGGIVGALVGLGFWKKEPALPDRLGDGAVLVGVPARGARRRIARHALDSAGAESVVAEGDR